MTTLTILRGLPGSGKSTWARKHVDSNTVIVSLDGLREMMAGGRQAWHETMNPQLNRILVRQAHTIISDLLAKGVNVISDSQHVNPRFCVDEVQIAVRHKAHVETFTFNTPLDELLERNRTRVESDRVPEKYLRTQYEAWHGCLERDSRWVNVRVMKTDGVYRMNPMGETVMVDVGLLWDGNARTVDDAEMGYTAASTNGRDATGTVRLDMPSLKDGAKWTLDSYSKWLKQGAHTTEDGFADFSADGSNLLDIMRDSDNVHVRPVKGETDVYACNFSRDAFKNQRWDEYSSKARGLFLDGNGRVVARGFEKFFNLGENEQTTRENIDKRLKFPVRVERKENGFLGLVSARGDGSWRFWSKSGQTDYSYLIQRLFKEMLDSGQEQALWNIVHDADVTLAFEVIDQESDRHIVKYDTSQLVFLHAIGNTVDFHIDHDADKLIDMDGFFARPEVLGVFQSDEEREALWSMLDEERHDSTREGVVVYDADGYMFKLKSDYYLEVKSLRTMLKRTVLHDRPIADNDHSERAEKARWVLSHANMNRLVYTRKAFNERDVDMEYVGDLLAVEGPATPDVSPSDAYRRTHAKERRLDGKNQRNV